MSHEVSGATSLCFTFIPISMRICRSVHYLRFLSTFGKKSLMMDHVSDRSINRLPIHHLNGFFAVTSKLGKHSLQEKKNSALTYQELPQCHNFFRSKPLRKKENKFQFILQTDVLLARHAICPPKRGVMRFLSSRFRSI